MRMLCMDLSSQCVSGGVPETSHYWTCAVSVLSACGCQTRPYPPFWICSFQRTLSPANLDLFILNRLPGYFAELRIAKELGGFESGIARVPEWQDTRPFGQYCIGKCWPSCHLSNTFPGPITVLW